MQKPVSDIETSAMRKISWRLIPFIALLYFAGFIDRVNVGFAAPRMNHDLRFSPYVYGLGAGIFFLSYCLFEAPSNLALYKVGARLWISRIMITWSILAGAMAFIHTPLSFYGLRFLLGAAEAGFFPGIVYYLTGWAPAAHRARLIGLFMTAIPLSTAVGAPISTFILSLNGAFGIAGWRWLFLLEAVPSLLLGGATLLLLRDKPEQAAWLTSEEKTWLSRTLEAERSRRPAQASGLLRALAHPRVLTLGLCYFGAEIGLYGVILWLPQILQNLGVSSANTGWAIAGPYAIAAAGGIALINALGNIGGFVGPFVVGWIKDRTGGYTLALLAIAGGMLMTGIIALILGHDSKAEYGEDAVHAAPALATKP